MRNTFQKIYVINLDRRPDRWETFRKQIPSDWPFCEIERVSAIDGKRVPSPTWWSSGNPAWGCYRTHLRLLEECMNKGVESVLLLEDDATFLPDFSKRVTEFLRHVPKDWGMLYLGGQHLHVKEHPPKPVNKHVYVPYNVNRTHAMALRGDTMKHVYKFLHEFSNWKKGNHIDHWLGRFHQERNPKYPVYCPGQWLIGQGPGSSDISGREAPDRVWPHAAQVSRQDVKPGDGEFIAVLGIHSSGSSALAGVLYHLGVDLGDRLTGYYGNDPNKSCGFEAEGLARICEQCIPFPTTKHAVKRQVLWNKLRVWINGRRKKGLALGVPVGGKYPMLCRCGAQLMNICQDKLILVHIDRPLEDSIVSLIKREGHRHPPELLRAHQQWLHEGKEWLLKEHGKHITIAYDELVRNPAPQVQRLIGYLNLSPSQEQLNKALQYPDPSKKHV